MWDPAVYRRFDTERSRPFFDLTGRIGAAEPRVVVDLGCGSGELTRTLAERWPGARIVGVDSSPEMIAAGTAGTAAGAGPVELRLGDIAVWRPEPDVDVVVTNAALQWVPGHQEMLVRWAAELPAGAWIALQVPGNFDSPAHRAARDVGGSRLAGVLRVDPVDDAAGYAELLTGAGMAVDAWETTYLHLLPAAVGEDHPVLRWLEGTALRPVRAVLDDADWAAYRAELGERIAAAYPSRHGLVAFPFRRVFTVGRTKDVGRTK